MCAKDCSEQSSAALLRCRASSADEAERLRTLYRDEAKMFGPLLVYRRCRRRDRWFQVVVPSTMAMHTLLVETSGLLESLTHLFEHVLRVPRVGGALAQPSSPTPSAALQLAVIACLRVAMDAGLLCSSSVAGRELVPALSSIGLQGSALSLSAAFLLGQTATLAGKSCRAAVCLLIVGVARASGCSFACRLLAKRWPGFVGVARRAAFGATYLVGTLAGLLAVLPLPIAAHGVARALDSLTQQAQRLRSPALWILARRCWRYWPGRGGPALGLGSSPGVTGRQWDVPVEVMVPLELCCPITLQLLYEPVLLHGDVFERSALELWLRRSPRHPLRSDIAADTEELQPALAMAQVCQDFATEHRLKIVHE